MNQWIFVNFQGAWKANRFPGWSFDVSTKCQIVALNAPGKYLADKMLILWHFSGITAPVVSGYHACGEWLQEFRQLTTCFISARTKSVSQHTSRFGGIRIPVPLLTSFVFDKTPLFIKLADKRHIGTGDWRCGYFACWAFYKVRMTVLISTFSVLELSRTPAPLWTISTICSLMPGFRVS